MGAIQFACDTSIFILLTWLGYPASGANVASRLLAAIGGFVLNGSLTFKGNEAKLGKKRLLRYLLTWILLTAISTFVVQAAYAWLGIQGAWYAKPLVEVLLAVCSFAIMRQWVYK
ncbi:hypothetical protein ASD68_15450 [Rhodanobacter sp. Root627]|nr:hypothetical protein ASD68_15450 [Rhodanobacter sp. Root627]